MILVNAEQRARRHPDTFNIPDLEDRESVRPGSMVKVIVNDRERLWVKITKRCQPRPGALILYHGTLANQPIVVGHGQYGDEVCLGPEHIMDIIQAAPRSAPEKT